MLEQVLESIGKALFVYVAVRFLWFWASNFYYYVLPRNQAKRLRSYGQWAVVTGCTDGIGRAYTMQLAKYGVNVVLISRDPLKLKQTALEIEKLNSDVKTRTISVDFSNTDIYGTIEREIADLDIGILINNVGMSEFNVRAPKLGEKELKTLTDTIAVNMVSVTAMSSIVLPKMQSKRRGLVVNIASISSLIPLPYIPVYSSSKSFVSHLSESIRMEYAEYGVEVQTAIPHFIVTKLARFKSPSFFIRTVESFVPAHINTFGIASFVHGCIPHEIIGSILRIISISPFIRDAYALRSMKKLVSRASENQ